MSLLSPFIGSPQSRYAAIAIVLAVISVSTAILFGADAMPISQKFFFILLIFLLSIPGILLSLMQLTCLVTGAGSDNKRWWCSLYSWLMSVFVIIYSILIIVVAVQSLLTPKDAFVGRSSTRRHGSNQGMFQEQSGAYPFPDAVSAPAGSGAEDGEGYTYNTALGAEVPQPIADPTEKQQFMLRPPVTESFIAVKSSSPAKKH